ncbi:hypothetical protein [Kineosporia sp. R_H_3]|uniref:hypothetical protein n=1 Tax=Kineosporia sp. R_H_3 TaxID=1961848 RepID=UPI000B4AA90B|nr:hypothetical protein [Kineosporia sp. R_H_3]
MTLTTPTTATTTGAMAGRAATRPRLSRPAVLLPVAAAWTALAGLLFAGTGRFSLAAVEAACAGPAPDVTFAPAPAAVRDFARTCGAQGLAAYRDLQVVDLLYPAVTALLLAGLALLLGRRAGVRPALLTLAPALAAVGDYTENVAAWALVRAGTAAPDWVGPVFRTGSLVKNVASWAAWTSVLALAVWAFARWTLHRRRAA